MPSNIVYRTNDKLLHGSEVAYSTNSLNLFECIRCSRTESFKKATL